MINDTCIAARTPFVYGGVVGMTGQAMTVIPGATACIRCVFETPPDEAEVESCREAGIVGPVAGAIGEMQASEAMRAVRTQRSCSKEKFSHTTRPGRAGCGLRR